MASAALLAALALHTVTAPLALADRVQPADAAAGIPCRVRNVTQDTRDNSFRRMVAAAHDGDRLRVRGTCSGGVTIRKSLVIEGVGPDAALSGRGRFRVLNIIYNRTPHETRVRLRDIRIVRGSTTGDGGGIRVHYATVTLIDSVVAGNTARLGGGIAVDGGDVTLHRTIVRGNTARGYGGGMWGDDNTLTLIDSVVRDNGASAGGGITNWDYGSLRLVRSSVRGNTAERAGGGILAPGGLSMRGSSVTGNTAGTDGGGIYHPQEAPQVVELLGSTVTGNTAGRHGGGLYIVTVFDDPPEDRVASLADTTVSGNHARVDGGGIYAVADPILTLTGSSVVTANDPNDCVGTSAC